MSEKLLVFSDDWGRHPSSCQHLARQFLATHSVTWVNTIGMRPPRLDWITVRRGAEKVAGWIKPASDSAAENDDTSGHIAKKEAGSANAHLSPCVIDAKMWPWMSRKFDRWLNRNLLSTQLHEAAKDAIAITTIPIVADLVGRLPVKRWVYYCVDDFSVWPGLDGQLLGQMEDDLVTKVDRTIAVSETLVESLRQRGCDPMLLTHGVDLEFWRETSATLKSPSRDGHSSEPSNEGNRHLNLQPDESGFVLFWGVVDRRLNADWVLALADTLNSTKIYLVGPMQDPDPRLAEHPAIRMPGKLPLDELPFLASRASVLIMPYADLPVTRAMQPLKLKEYLATGRPVVVSNLPAVRSWSNYVDVAHQTGQFVELVRERLEEQDQQIPAESDLADRLLDESWTRKAADFMRFITAESEIEML